MGRIKRVADETEQELQAFLNELDWNGNPFTHPAGLEEYVFPSPEDIADISSALQNYTGPLLIHSRMSGVGKTTMLRMVLEDFEDSHNTIRVGEHNVTPYELVAIVADEIGVGKSSSTKLTEQKIRNADLDEEWIIGIDEFGLNDPDTLHTIQFLNDHGFKIILTGMTSQWESISSIGSDGKAFQRRVSLKIQLEPFDFEQTKELYKRRVHTVVDVDDWEDVSLEPFGEAVLKVVHEESHGVPAVVTSSLNELLGLGAFRYKQGATPAITTEIAEAIDYADPIADE